MLDSGDFVRPRFVDEPLYEKPIGIYWLQAAAVACVGRRDRICTYRIPSLLGAMLAVLGTFLIGARRIDRKTALLAAALLCASPVLVVEADLATTDAALLACVVLSQGCLAEIYLAGERGARAGVWAAIGLWVGLGLGTLIKGPVAPALTLLTIVALRLSKRPVRVNDLRIAWGLPLLAAIVAPWALAVGAATGWSFYGDALRNDILPKLIGGQESHGAPPGYYLALAPVTFWPGSFVMLPAVWAAIRERDDPAVRFALAWLVPTWLLFEALPTKLPHYVMPTYPALALLCARWVGMAAETSRSRLERVSWVSWIVVGLASAAVIPAAAALFAGSFQRASIVPAILAMMTVIAGKRMHERGDRTRATWIAILGGGSMLVSTLAIVLPGLEALWPTVRAARIVADRTTSSSRPIVVVGYREPSLVFLLGGDVARLDTAEAARFVASQPTALAWVDDSRQSAFESASIREAFRVAEIASVDGWNISKGRRVRLHLFERADDPHH